ncbi:efflux RND transporter permease subunit [Chitinophaga varians]|uniref:efflux RND transporter permease subunit n=1 Tax=Chitinophaga varians TaxID=2202339 RepID=UPI00165F1A64|nr:efflux RND transporter permease subunit [Chitinophaga varians]MBC9911125.1 efflux RND transporter permease subunit [Chitinophaga varians]
MIRFIIQRPIAMLMTFGVLIILGILALFRIPVALLPDIDVPGITIRCTYPGNTAAAIEANVTGILRDNLTTIAGLEDIETISSNHTATLYLRLSYGTNTNLAYMAINEKLDRLTNSLPQDMERPVVIRSNTSDIPVARVQIIPENSADYQEYSNLSEKIFRKRIEQLPGVSMADINGKSTPAIIIEPDAQSLAAVKLDVANLANAIQSANMELGTVTVKDGHYSLRVNMDNQLISIEQIKNIPVSINNNTAVMPLSRFATVSHSVNPPDGYHLYGGRQGLVLNVHKQSGARMHTLMPAIDSLISDFGHHYPGARFYISQNQHYLLEAGIDNLQQDLLYGGILCVLVLFLFLGNFVSPVLMSISIPLSLILTFIFFYLFGISFNIISLSGLALGIGMLIDNSIVVLDNISRKRKEGLSVEDSCVVGTNEVMVPVISQVLTTVAVYLPLIYLSGLAGAIITDQAIALTISLGVSLLVAFFLNPLLFRLFISDKAANMREDTRLYQWIAGKYHQMIHHIFARKKPYFFFTIALMPVGIILYQFIPVSALPHITQTETLLTIDWNNPVDLAENHRRIKQLESVIGTHSIAWEADLGLRQFLLTQQHHTLQQAEIYYKCRQEKDKIRLDTLVNTWLQQHYPDAVWKLEDAPNAFTQLFRDNSPYFEARLKPVSTGADEDAYTHLLQALQALPSPAWKKGAAFQHETCIEFTPDIHKMQLYGISMASLKETLQRLFGNYTISEIKRFGEIKTIRFSRDNADITTALSHTITGKNNTSYPLSAIIAWNKGQSPRYLTGDKTGTYHGIVYTELSRFDYDHLQQNMTAIAAKNGYNVNFSGRYFTEKQRSHEILVTVLIAILLLYFILAVQFENLVQPLIIMLTMPLGISGALLIVYLAGGTLDIMAGVGFVVVLGIIVDDPILKMETLRRLRNNYETAGMSRREAMTKAIHEAGEICLKPLLMTSLTTSLALMPVLFTGGIGNDLQKPLVYVIAGGLTIGSFFTLWFIPLAYWFFTKKD